MAIKKAAKKIAKKIVKKAARKITAKVVEKPTQKRAKLFKNGQSQAVRLPKEFRFVGTEVIVRRVKEGVLLEPIGPQVAKGDLATARMVLQTLGPLRPEFAEVLEETLQKLNAAEKAK